MGCPRVQLPLTAYKGGEHAAVQPLLAWQDRCAAGCLISDTCNKADKATSSTHLGRGSGGLHNTLSSVSWDVCDVQLHIATCCNAMHIAELACGLCCCPGSAVQNAWYLPYWTQAQGRPCCKTLPGRRSSTEHQDCLQMGQSSGDVSLWLLGPWARAKLDHSKCSCSPARRPQLSCLRS